MMRTDPYLVNEAQAIAKKWEPFARSVSLMLGRLDEALGGRSINELVHHYELTRETFTEYQVGVDSEREIAAAVLDLYAMPGAMSGDLQHALGKAIDRYAEIDDEEYEARLCDQRAVMREGVE